MIELRSGTVDDAGDMALLESRASPHPWNARQYRDSLSTGAPCLLMSENGLLCGLILVMLISPEAEILNLAIDPALQGRGLGRQLLTAMLQTLRAVSVERVFLEVRESNRIARRLYRGMGFNENGLRKHYYPTETGREHAILMELSL